MLTRNRRLLLFTALYFAQGTIMSYFLTFNILYLGEHGYSPKEVGIFQGVLVVPFVLKIFLGMLSDGVDLFGMGHRKPYIIIGLLGQGIALIIASFISVEEGLGAFAVMAFIASICMALYDTCTDGLALDTTPENERGIVQGMMVGGRAAGILGMLLAGGFIAETFGWQFVFFAISIVAFLPLILVFPMREDAQQMHRQAFQWSAFKAFGQGAVLLLAAVGLIYALALDGVLLFLSDHLKNAMAVSLGNVGVLVALSMVGRIIGALSNSWITDRIGHRQSLFIAIALASLGCFGLAFGGGVGWVAFMGFLFGLAYGYYNAVYAAVAMDLSDPRISASMFAIFMMFINVGTVGGQVLGGVLTEQTGFNTMVIIMGAINLLNVFLVLGVFRKRKA
ncbi:MAG: MFS transporter [Anaerolineales bacterium]|jgi:PAT family beta-lactamase induction signal transducer AmpG